MRRYVRGFYAPDRHKCRSVGEYSSAFSDARICGFQADFLGLAVGLSAFLLLGVKGLGGVFSIFRRTSSRVGSLAMADDIPDLISAEHTRAIGLLVLALSVIESRATDLLCSILRLSVVEGLAAFHHQQLSGRLDTIIALLDLNLRKPAEAKKGEFDSIFETLAKAKDLAEYRNTVVHAAWIIGDDGQPMSVRFSARGEFRRSRKTHGNEEILGRVREANEIAASLEALAAAFRT